MEVKAYAKEPLVAAIDWRDCIPTELRLVTVIPACYVVEWDECRIQFDSLMSLFISLERQGFECVLTAGAEQIWRRVLPPEQVWRL